MAPSPDRWYVAADDVLAALVAGYVAQGVDLPDRQLVTPGLPAWDCDMLAVQVEREFSYSGSVAQEVIEPLTEAVAFAMRGAQLGITLLRCVPTSDEDGNPPTAASEQAAAELILTDSQRMLNVLVAAVRAGDIGGCNSVAFMEWVSQGPQGGLGGGLLRVRLGT